MRPAKSNSRAKPLSRSRAFSSEVDTGSREENASKQKDRAPFRFHRNGKGSSLKFTGLETLLTDERVERRLAAVLAADVAGYSRLMGRDEERTLSDLKSLRKTLVDPAIT